MLCTFNEWSDFEIIIKRQHGVELLIKGNWWPSREVAEGQVTLDYFTTTNTMEGISSIEQRKQRN